MTRRLGIIPFYDQEAWVCTVMVKTEKESRLVVGKWTREERNTVFYVNTFYSIRVRFIFSVLLV
jgi:hypothetical protein